MNSREEQRRQQMTHMLTIIIPWYGDKTAGGAETQARSLATALHRSGVPVRVWASTGRDSFHPEDTTCYPAGHSTLDGISVWRFVPHPTDERGVPAFFHAHPALLPPIEQFPIHELRLLASLLSSDELYEAIWRERATSHFLFMPYAFPTTFWGGLIAPQQSVVVPCLHDEPYARYATYRYFFSRVGGVLCNSNPEAALVQRLYDIPAHRVHIPGEGINLTPRGNAANAHALLRAASAQQQDAALHHHHTQHPYNLLYVGRRDETKNVWSMVSYVREYWARRGTPLRLILVGRNDIVLPPSLAPVVLDVGFVAEAEKHDLYAAADLFLQPSLYESFSIVLMEAWLQKTPALVHHACAVTADHCHRSGGGVTFGTFATFAAALDILLPDAALRHRLGECGHHYVLDTCNWHHVAQRTADAITTLNKYRTTQEQTPGNV